MAIEGQTGFQTQGIARAKAHRLDPLIGQQGFPQGLGLSGRHVELETQLTGVAGAAHQQLAALPGGLFIYKNIRRQSQTSRQ